jgi:hypothetical protein
MRSRVRRMSDSCAYNQSLYVHFVLVGAVNILHFRMRLTTPAWLGTCPPHHTKQNAQNATPLPVRDSNLEAKRELEYLTQFITQVETASSYSRDSTCTFAVYHDWELYRSTNRPARI